MVFLIFVASPSSPHPGTLFTHLLKCNISDALAFLPPLQSLFSGLKVNNYKLFSSRGQKIVATRSIVPTEHISF